MTGQLQASFFIGIYFIAGTAWYLTVYAHYYFCGRFGTDKQKAWAKTKKEKFNYFLENLQVRAENFSPYLFPLSMVCGAAACLLLFPLSIYRALVKLLHLKKTAD